MKDFDLRCFQKTSLNYLLSNGSQFSGKYVRNYYCCASRCSGFRALRTMGKCTSRHLFLILRRITPISFTNQRLAHACVYIKIGTSQYNGIKIMRSFWRGNVFHPKKSSKIGNKKKDYNCNNLCRFCGPYCPSISLFPWHG